MINGIPIIAGANAFRRNGSDPKYSLAPETEGSPTFSSTILRDKIGDAIIFTQSIITRPIRFISIVTKRISITIISPKANTTFINKLLQLSGIFVVFPDVKLSILLCAIRGIFCICIIENAMSGKIVPSLNRS